MSFIENILPFKIEQLDGFVKVLVAGQQIGWTTDKFSKQISALSDVWQLVGQALVLNETLQTFDERTQAIDEVFVQLSDNGTLPPMPDYALMGGIDWISVCPLDNETQPLFTMKRFYNTCLGVRTNSIMLNGYRGDHYWVAIRSMHVENGAGKMDVISAGMVRHGETILEGLHHEAEEEAGISTEDIKAVKAAGTLYLPNIGAYNFLNNEMFHIFDIELKDKDPKVMLPLEVQGFRLLPVQEVIEITEKGNSFKEHINVVVTDFLVRHGHLNDHPQIDQINTLLYRDLHVTADRT